MSIRDRIQKAETIPTRLKMYVYGGTGTGKTVTSLHFPDPLVVDAEKGTTHYGKYFKFDRIFTDDPDELEELVNDLLKDPAGYKTLVVDPFTTVYDKLLSKYEKRLKIKLGKSDYELQPKDYRYIKKKVKEITRLILSLDMNIIFTAHSAYDYSQEEFMKITGTKAEGPKKLPHMFDVVLELSTTEEGKFMAKVHKDRTNDLPPLFEFSYNSFTEYLGIEGLEREAVVFNQESNVKQEYGRNHKVELNGETVYTAGITAESIKKIQELVETRGEDEIADKINEDYSVQSVLDLKEDEAQLLIKDYIEESE